ncbi:lipase family protein [Chryseobacterium sp. Tr-659]|uniref:lipase family protein n=1 Tax=Chryseobacterium sp. Tr-659 TaxID=2608340 RepID=UPI001421B852|nr:lipase family protein [Chryseobacterium sp. Tr-659]NIF05955.1 lipase family protein [Chryseobacterium sp. Tr-659]
MTNPSLDAYQQVFGMASLANRAGGYKGKGTKLQEQLQYDLSYYFNNVPPVEIMKQKSPSIANPSVTPLLGNWNLVWGPALIEETDEKGNPTNVADNALYVAQCDAVAFPGGPTIPAYVVAIAATNPSSLYDWETEDFSVSEVVNWTTYDPSNFSPSPYNGNDPYISKGTATGISILLGLTSPNNAAAPNTTLQQFLAGLRPDPGTAIIFCGHSLAGALSPTLALYLKENKDLNAFGVTLVYPTAGPTPGEAAFAKLFNTTFPPLPPGWQAQSGTYQSWNTMHWNDLDVVPHAWQKADLKEIVDIYGQPTTNTVIYILEALRKIAIDDASKSGATYTRVQNQSLPGKLQNSDGSVTIKTPPETIHDYMFQLALQHVDMYSGIPASDGHPQVNGLILPQPLPKPSPTKLVPGVTIVTRLDMILKIISQIIGWISARYIQVEQESARQNVEVNE